MKDDKDIIDGKNNEGTKKTRWDQVTFELITLTPQML